MAIFDLSGRSGAAQRTTVRIETREAWVEFPVFNARSRSLKKTVLSGTVRRTASNVVAMPLRTYSTGMRVRLAMGVVTSIDPEILLLDEGIGAVDAEFLKKAQTRLQKLVERSGILVFASHSNEFLARLCKTAMWIDHGTVRMEGGIEEVVGAYEGPDAARHVREVLEETRLR